MLAINIRNGIKTPRPDVGTPGALCYAFMQATGMVNDHVTGCFRYNEVG